MESLWNNRDIKYKGKPICFEAWINKGIFFPQQLECSVFPLTLSEIQSKYELDSMEFYNFLKIKTALSKSKLHRQIPPLPNFITKINSLGHQVSHIYKLLCPQSTNLNKKLITFWEQHASSFYLNHSGPKYGNQLPTKKCPLFYHKQNFGSSIKLTGPLHAYTISISGQSQPAGIVKRK